MRNVAARPALQAGAACALLLLGACASTQEEAAPAASASAQPPLDAPAPEFPRKPWNAEEMTRLTAELQRAVRDVRRAWRKDPIFREPKNPNRRSALVFDQRLRELDQRTTQLANRVKAGDGYDQTLNIARNILVILTDLDMWGRRLMTGAWMQERVQPAMQLINEIAAYYGSDALYDIETLERVDRPARQR